MTEPPPHLNPIVGPRDEWKPVTVTFTCDRCAEDACTLTLLPPFAQDPQAPARGAPGWIAGKGTLFEETVRLSIDGPVANTRPFLPGATLSALEAAMGAGDVAGLYAIDPEYAPQWCRTCVKNYCRACWVVWVEFDDGFYDCTRGRCPEAHERNMDD